MVVSLYVRRVRSLVMGGLGLAVGGREGRRQAAEISRVLCC